MVKAGNKEKDFEILLSTINRTSLSFLQGIFPDGDFLNYKILVINQTSKDNLLTSEINNIRVINSFEVGLSKSRNLAIENARGDICIFADDDITYFKNFDKIIIQSFEKHNQADMITFQMADDQGKLYNKYPNIVNHDKRSVRTVNSVVIAFYRKKIIKEKVIFNINFGLGSIFETADEYIFLRSALKAKLNVCFEPITILKHPCFSSGKAVSSDKIIFARSAVFYKYNGELTYLKLCWHLFLLLKSGNLNFNQVFKKYHIGLKGIKKYKSLWKNGLETRNS